MNISPFQALINLVNFDQRISLYTKTIASLIQELQDLKNQRQSIEQELDKAKRAVVDMRKNVDQQELHMKELDAHERNKKKQLENLNNYKEYQSIKSELDHIQAQQQAQEQEVIVGWNKLEAAQAAYGALQPSIEEKLVAIDLHITQIMQDLHINEQESNKAIAQRPLLEKEVPIAWLEKYILMRARVHNPVMPVEQNSCSACFYPLTGQDILQIKNGALVQCKGCFRLLFLEQLHGSVTPTVGK